MPAAATTVTADTATAELDRQVAILAGLGHAASPVDLEALRATLPAGAAEGTERIPFVLVVPALASPAHEAMARLSLRGRPGSVNQHAGDIDAFTPIEPVQVPGVEAYLLLDVERGSEFRNVPPEPAVATLAERGRTPLTVAEGIALVTVRPDVLEKNHCFSLAGSRHGDRRVPALWISKGAPHLGWCFAGTPHSWLGVASAGARVTPGAPRG